MFTDVIAFDWHYPVAGYVLVDGEELTTPPGVNWAGLGQAVAPPPKGRGLLELRSPFGAYLYRPDQEQPALFREFAGLPPDDEEAILAFANRFGMLGESILAWWDLRPDPPKQGATFEPLSSWAASIRELRHALRLHEIVRRGDRGAAAAVLRWGLPADPHPQAWFIRSDFDADPDAFAAWWLSENPAAPPEAVRWQYDRMCWVQVYTGQMPSPSDDPLVVVRTWVDGHIKYRVEGMATVTYAIDPDHGRRVFQVRANHLIGLMWLQFARAVAGEKEYRACKECRTWFELGARDDGRKGRRVFCGDPCKLKDYRRRKQTALEMKARRKSPRQIAEATDTDLATVEKWLKPKGGK